MFPGGLPFPPPLAPHRGVLILVLGIVGLAVNMFGIIGAIAWYLANQDLPQMDAGRMDPAGRGMTTAGKVCGIIGFILGMLGCLWLILWIVLVAGGMAGAWLPAQS